MLTVILSLTILTAKCSGNIVDSLPKCNVSDNECLIRHAELLFRSHDPMFVEKMTINQKDEGAIGINLEYRNTTTYGLKNTRVLSVKGVKADPYGKVEIRFKIPTVTTLATYSAKSKISLLDIYTKGNVNLTFVDEDAKLLLLQKGIRIDNEIYMQVVKAKLDFNIAKLVCHLDTSIKGGKVIEPIQVLSQFISDNCEEILSEMKPVIAKAFAKVYKDTINDVYIKKPFNSFFVE